MEAVYSIPNCKCGKIHSSPTEKIEICENALHILPLLTENHNKIVLVSDSNTWEACGKSVYELIKSKVVKNLVYKTDAAALIPDEKAIEQLEQCVGEIADLIIGVGSGVINDLCKHVSYKNGLPYFIVATAASMDGYASSGAALILGGMKVTLGARPPKAIIADIDVLRNEPLDMLRSGYGDIIGKYSCLNDWELSAFINGEYFCDSVYSLVLNTTDRVKELAEKIVSRDKYAIGELMTALVNVGMAMAFVGNSRPASGSEHHLSHFFEITGILDNAPYLTHGTDVIYSSYETACLREKIINISPHPEAFDEKNWEKEIRRIYKSSADGVIALQKKAGFYNKTAYEFVKNNMEHIRNILKKSPKPAEINEMCERVGLYRKEFIQIYGDKKIKDAVKYAKDLKDRYTVLWLYNSFFA